MPKPIIVAVSVASACLALAAGACTSDKAPTSTASTASRPEPAGSTAPSQTPVLIWPAPGDPLERARAAALEPAVKEHLTFHVHAHLDVFLDGRPVTVPAGIGINIKDPGVRSFPGVDGSTTYGGIERCGQPCISPLHTHDVTGILHTESARLRPNTLGEFFVEWGVPLSDSCVGEYCVPERAIAVYVDGKAYQRDPRGIELTDMREIAVVIGTPPAEIPSTGDFSQA
jgi:hypothetical protein